MGPLRSSSSLPEWIAQQVQPVVWHLNAFSNIASLLVGLNKQQPGLPFWGYPEEKRQKGSSSQLTRSAPGLRAVLVAHALQHWHLLSARGGGGGYVSDGAGLCGGVPRSALELDWVTSVRSKSYIYLKAYVSWYPSKIALIVHPPPPPKRRRRKQNLGYAENLGCYMRTCLFRIL